MRKRAGSVSYIRGLPFLNERRSFYFPISSCNWGLPLKRVQSKPRSFGFVKYRNTDDAAEAKYHMNNQIIGGRQISIVFAKEDSKSPEEMNAKAQMAFEGRSPPRSARHLHHSHRHSISPAEGSTSRVQSSATRSPYSEDKAESTREEREDTSE